VVVDLNLFSSVLFIIKDDTLVVILFVCACLQLIKFLKGFTAEERIKLAKVVGYCLANGLGSAACISSLFEEHLVKDGRYLLLITQCCLHSVYTERVQHSILLG